jgi:hypothetical protein
LLPTKQTTIDQVERLRKTLDINSCRFWCPKQIMCSCLAQKRYASAQVSVPAQNIAGFRVISRRPLSGALALEVKTVSVSQQGGYPCSLAMMFRKVVDCLQVTSPEDS